MDLVVLIVIGGLVGWLASIVMGTNRQMGILANVVVGIVGSWLGQWVATAAGIVAVDSVGRFLVAMGGAALLILILKGLKVYR